MPFIREMFAAIGWDGELDEEGIKTFDELERLVFEHHDADAGSYTFRYPINKQGEGSVDDQFTSSATEFANHMDLISGVLEGATVGVPEEWKASVEIAAAEADLHGGWE